MFWHLVRKWAILPIVLIVAGLSYWALHPHSPKFLTIGYIGDRTVTLWSTLAQVRQPIIDLHYGDRVEVTAQEGAAAQVRTVAGTIGWLLDSRQVMDAKLWRQSAELLTRARTLPVQSRGQTKAASNVRVEPGRDGARIYKFPRGTPVVVLGRAVRDVASGSEENSTKDKVAGTETQKPKREDWLFVMRSDAAAPVLADATRDAPAATKRASGDPVSGGPAPAQPVSSATDSSVTAIAGWVLSRFVEPELPGPVRDYASSANRHVVAFFELNRVPDSSGGEAPQYLAALSRGGEGSPCDFTMLQVYTWGAARKRYETAYVESNLCGLLPIRISTSPKGPEFRFPVSEEGASERVYAMQQTSVRRVRDASSRPPPRKK